MIQFVMANSRLTPLLSTDDGLHMTSDSRLTPLLSITSSPSSSSAGMSNGVDPSLGKLKKLDEFPVPLFSSLLSTPDSVVLDL